ncbi:MAG: DUF2066 domain-containing protein, partial [Gammaproteobacteria bacterium]
DPADPVATAMHQAAQMRGLPLELPLMDLADQRQVSDFDIRTLNLADLNAAAQRYGTQAMLVGTIRALDQGVAADWNLVFGNTTTPFAGTAATPQAAAADAVGQAATLLASQLAYVPQSGGVTGKLNLVVEQVANLQAEVAVQKLIAGAQGVSSARLVAIENDTVHFEVSYTGSSADLARALTLNGSLAQDNNPVAAPATAIGAGAPQYVLYFRYTP